MRAQVKKPIPSLLAGLLLALITATLIVPVLKSISSGFVSEGQLSTYWFGRVITNPVLMNELGNGLLLASTTTLVSLGLALPLAICRSRYTFSGLGMLSVLVLVPLILPPFVGAIP